MWDNLHDDRNYFTKFNIHYLVVQNSLVTFLWASIQFGCILCAHTGCPIIIVG